MSECFISSQVLRCPECDRHKDLVKGLTYNYNKSKAIETQLYQRGNIPCLQCKNIYLPDGTSFKPNELDQCVTL